VFVIVLKEEMRRVQKILVPTDGSQNAMKAVHKAVELAKHLPDAEVSIIYVYPPRSVAHAIWVSEEAYQEAFEREAKKTSAETSQPLPKPASRFGRYFAAAMQGPRSSSAPEEKVLT
jgi:nucleotide-binding universal stress UspA family protein